MKRVVKIDNKGIVLSRGLDAVEIQLFGLAQESPHFRGSLTEQIANRLGLTIVREPVDHGNDEVTTACSQLGRINNRLDFRDGTPEFEETAVQPEAKAVSFKRCQWKDDFPYALELQETDDIPLLDRELLICAGIIKETMMCIGSSEVLKEFFAIRNAMQLEAARRLGFDPIIID